MKEKVKVKILMTVQKITDLYKQNILTVLSLNLLLNNKKLLKITY